MDRLVCELLDYAIRKGLIEDGDQNWAANRILEVMHLDSYTAPEELPAQRELSEILKDLCDGALKTGALAEDSVVYRDLFDTKLMGSFMAQPSRVRTRFKNFYAQSPRMATDWYYTFSQDTNYIRRDRIAKDVRWVTKTPYGDLDITINLSKPEKDPKAIAAAKLLPQADYPKCMLCRENEGYAGRVNFPARQNHRTIPVTIDQRKWFMQYSPYVYYNEHCIVFNSEHKPMQIDRSTFRKLMDFIRQFPHYFVGSNADLPIVGGSILSHDHFQGGHYAFAMEKAPVETPLYFQDHPDVEAGIVRWPMSVIRLRCEDDNALVELADHILKAWRSYTDEAAFIFAETDGEPHNTITPIARMRDGRYELDLVLRNNITTPEHPLGVFHPHAQLHHIKKENIGLIEVMGLAVLPARLKEEMQILADTLVNGGDPSADPVIAIHADWARQLQTKYVFTRDNVDGILKQEIGMVFSQVLEHAGVFKRDEEGKAAFLRFTESL